MKPFEIQIDEVVTETLLTEAERGARVFLTTGYFNLTQAYMDLVLGTRAEYQILLASPEVNGFFGAKGVAGAIPAAYVHIERQFYRAVCGRGQQERVRLQEYWRRGWTFHAKGTGAAGGGRGRGRSPAGECHPSRLARVPQAESHARALEAQDRSRLGGSSKTCSPGPCPRGRRGSGLGSPRAWASSRAGHALLRDGAGRALVFGSEQPTPSPFVYS